MIDAASKFVIASSSDDARRNGLAPEVDPAWRGVWQAAVERTQTQTWFHGSPKAETQSPSLANGQSDDNALPPGNINGPGDAAASVAEQEVSAIDDDAAPVAPTSAFMSTQSARSASAVTLRDTSYASNLSPWQSISSVADASARQADIEPPAMRAYAQTVLREWSARQPSPVQWHVAWADDGVMVWLGVAVSHADLADAIVRELHTALTSRGIPLRGMTVNGTLLSAPDDTGVKDRDLARDDAAVTAYVTTIR